MEQNLNDRKNSFDTDTAKENSCSSALLREEYFVDEGITKKLPQSLFSIRQNSICKYQSMGAYASVLLFYIYGDY